MFRWADFLTLAEQLVQQAEGGGLRDACLRSAISRSYYAALLTAACWIRDCVGIDIPEDRTIHKSVPELLASAAVEEEARQVAPALHRLRHQRSNADYKDDVPHLRKVAELSLELAKHTVFTLERLSQ